MPLPACIPTRSHLAWLALVVPLLVALASCGTTSASVSQAGRATSATPLATLPARTTMPFVNVDNIVYAPYTDPTFGFSLDIPTFLGVNGSQPDPTDGGGITAWNGTYPDAQSSIALYIATATKGIDPRMCQMGTPITIGPGLKGYEQDIFAGPTPAPMPNSGGASNAQVSASVVENGVWVSIDLRGMPPADTFIQRYGAIWHELLSSFTPGTSANPDATNNPCAG